MLTVRKAEIDMYRKPRYFKILNVVTWQAVDPKPIYFKIRNVVTWQAVATRQEIDPTSLQPKAVSNAIAR